MDESRCPINIKRGWSVDWSCGDWAVQGVCSQPCELLQTVAYLYIYRVWISKDATMCANVPDTTISFFFSNREFRDNCIALANRCLVSAAIRARPTHPSALSSVGKISVLCICVSF